MAGHSSQTSFHYSIILMQFQVHSTYKCLICVDIEAYCMCFWAITLPLHIAVLRHTTHTQPEGAPGSTGIRNTAHVVWDGRTHFKWHACHWLDKGAPLNCRPNYHKSSWHTMNHCHWEVHCHIHLHVYTALHNFYSWSHIACTLQLYNTRLRY